MLEAGAARVGQAHGFVERILSGVPERRVGKVVGERNRLSQVFVEVQGASDRTCQLRDLHRMVSCGCETVALVVEEDLGLVHEPAKCAAAGDAVTVALIVVARRRGRLEIPSAARLRGSLA